MFDIIINTPAYYLLNTAWCWWLGPHIALSQQPWENIIHHGQKSGSSLDFVYRVPSLTSTVSGNSLIFASSEDFSMYDFLFKLVQNRTNTLWFWSCDTKTCPLKCTAGYPFKFDTGAYMIPNFSTNDNKNIKRKLFSYKTKKSPEFRLLLSATTYISVNDLSCVLLKNQ